MSSDYIGGDSLSFAVNGVQQSSIAGIVEWEQRTIYLSVGPQTLQWIYAKDGASYGGADAGWVDQVQFTPGGTAPLIQIAPQNQIVWVGSNATLNATAVGTPPLQYQWQFNSTNLSNATNTALTLTNVQFAQEGNYSLVVSNGFGFTNAGPAYLNVVDFDEAANATNLTWVAGGAKPWFAQTSATHDGVAALRSGAITANQQSVLQTTVNGPGTVSYWWKVSSETNNDYANFAVDGAEQFRISGTVNWQPRTCYLTPGTHVLSWSYSKNASVNLGYDAAWLDEVSYTEGFTPAFIAAQPTSIVISAFSNATFAASYGGTPPLNYQWWFNGSPLADATNAILALTNVQTANAGLYSVAVSNAFGNDVSSNASLTLLGVYAWGAGRSNTYYLPQSGQSIVPSGISNVVAIAAGVYHSVALRTNGTVIAWGWNGNGQTNVPMLTNASAIAAGYGHSMALRSNGTVVVWGVSPYGNVSSVPASATNVTAIAAGWYHNLALRSNGTVVAWGAGQYYQSFPNSGQSMVPTNLFGVTAIAAGTAHSMALRTNGTVIAWGLNASGQTNVPFGLSNVVAIAAGASNSFALKNDGTLVAWGDNAFGQTKVPPGLTDVSAISAGAGHQIVLRMDGTLLAWGLNNNGQTNVVPGLTNIQAIAAGGYHTLALLNFGPIALLNQPWNQTLFKGDTATFKVGVSGIAPVSYQWQFNSTDLPGQTNQWLTLLNSQLTDTGFYRLIATNSFGAVTSSVAMLQVNDTLPFFVQQPPNMNVLLNSNATTTAVVGGVGPFRYQWRFNDTNLPAQTNITLVITNSRPQNEGFYSVIASNALGYAISSNAYLNVIDLAESLNATNLVWLSSTNPGWFPEIGLTHDNVAAASTGYRSLPYYPATLQTTVSGPGTLSFWWYYSSSVPNYPLNFLMDGVVQASTGSSAWKQQI
ncbi:MAG TPA: immunoglobulin domain-containing protein, partial [Candidatus Paceibacterota bacterium]|nr:immunoglobulin domain-containing protein [Candidatus Paceibacterota bacterium]